MRMGWTARRALLSLASVWGCALATAAFAEQSAREGLQTRIKVGGQELSCRDFRGQIVRSIHMDDLGDVAHARIVNRMPIITLNKRRLDTLPDKLQVFSTCSIQPRRVKTKPTATRSSKAAATAC